MDFRFFALGNLIAIIASLANEQQSQAIMDLIEQRWQDLVEHTPMKICFPALEGRDWQILTGSDPKNVPWSYHNSGNWPVLMWLLVAQLTQLCCCSAQRMISTQTAWRVARIKSGAILRNIRMGRSWV